MIRKLTLPLLAVAGVVIAIVMVIEGGRTISVAQPAGNQGSAPFASYVFGPGIVEASSENISVGTPVSGIVTAIYVKWGDRVKSGQPLFKIDDRDLQSQLPPAIAKIKETQAQEQPAIARVKEAEATLAKAENRLKVGESLEPGVSISAEELASRRFDVGIDKAALDSAQGQIEQINTQVSTAESQVEQLKAQIAWRTIRAPISGRILQLKTRPGEYAQAGVPSTPFLVLGDDQKLHVRVDVDENDAWKFQPCAPAVASVRGNPNLKTPLQYVRTEPDVIPKSLITGDVTQRTDTRVLQVVYSFDPSNVPVYVGQLMDVFIETPADSSAGSQRPIPGKPCAGNSGKDDSAHQGTR